MKEFPIGGGGGGGGADQPSGPQVGLSKGIFIYFNPQNL